MRNIKDPPLRYSENKRLHTLRFDNTLLLKVVRGILQNFFYVCRLFVPLWIQGVLLSLTHFAFCFPYWISPATLFHLTTPASSFWIGSVVYGFRPDLTHGQIDTSFWFPTEAILRPVLPPPLTSSFLSVIGQGRQFQGESD